MASKILSSFIALLIGSTAWADVRPDLKQATDVPARSTTVLAKHGRLILDDDGSKNRGRKTIATFGDSAKLRAGAGTWKRATEKSNVWRSTWKPGMGHVPVAAYHGFKTNNLIVEVKFRYGDNREP